jgi:hypothetical protein
VVFPLIRCRIADLGCGCDRTASALCHAHGGAARRARGIIGVQARVGLPCIDTDDTGTSSSPGSALRIARWWQIQQETSSADAVRAHVAEGHWVKSLRAGWGALGHAYTVLTYVKVLFAYGDHMRFALPK